MRVIIQNDYENLSLWAARYVAKTIQSFAPTADRPFVLGLPTGSTPMGFYKELIRLNREGNLSFANVITFNMDEYVGLSKEHEQSYHYFMWKHFFSHIDIKAENTNILDGMAEDLDAECMRYEQKIADVGGVDLFVGGIGSDGHIAFNEPFSSLSSVTRMKSLTSDTRAINSRFFDNDISKVPSLALTVGVKTLLDSREVMILVSGHSKALALAQALEGGVSHLYTCSAMQLHPKAIFVCDDAACGELKMSTYWYFKDIESENLDVPTIRK